jgi:ATP-dependent 26S proteasome regulatory subunit
MNQRFDAQTGADREVQRILLELLNQMDGFDQMTNVKVMTRFSNTYCYDFCSFHLILMKI